MIDKNIKIIEQILNRARFPDFNILDEEVRFLLQTVKSLESLLEQEISGTKEYLRETSLKLQSNEVEYIELKAYIRGLQFSLDFLKKEYA